MKNPFRKLIEQKPVKSPAWFQKLNRKIKKYSLIRWIRLLKLRSYCTHKAKGLDDKHVCLNCGNEFTGNYCNVCGQNHQVERITMKTITQGFAYGLTNMDSRIVWTIVALFLRPGSLILDYLKGKRVDFFRPFQLLFVLSAIYGVLLHFCGGVERIDLSMISVNVKDLEESGLWKAFCQVFALDKHTYVRKFLSELYNTYQENMAFRAILAIPFYALATKWAFRKSLCTNYPFNFIELLFVRAYVSCQIMAASILWFPFATELDNWVEVVLSTWTYLQLFGGNRWSTLRRIVLMYIYAFLQIGAIIVILSLILIIIAAIFGGQTLQFG